MSSATGQRAVPHERPEAVSGTTVQSETRTAAAVRLDPRSSALVFDWGGVLTAPLSESTAEWMRASSIDPQHWRAVLIGWRDQEASGAAPSPVHQLERGELPVPEFEAQLAGALAAHGTQVEPAGLLDGMLAGLSDLMPDMIAMIRDARAAGARTALLSNSWGEHYQDALWDNLFDVVVISGRLGMRKPEEQIFAHTVDLLGLPAGQCVMIDDMRVNIQAAQRFGMLGILHVDTTSTIAEVHRMFGLAGDTAGSAATD